jgi:hypothetical protein
MSWRNKTLLTVGVILVAISPLVKRLMHDVH